MCEFCLKTTVVVIFLHHQFSLHFFQVFLEDLIVPVLFCQVITLYKDDIAHLIVHHPHQRIYLIVVDLVVQFSTDKTLPIGE